MRIVVFLLTFFVSFCPAHAQLDTEQSLESLGWISGTWLSGSPEQSQTEIIWSERRGDAFVGTWRTIRENALIDYEILTIIQSPEGIEYRFDLFRKSAGYQSPQSNRFFLQEVRDGYARFRHSEENATLTMIRDEQSRLVGTWIDHDTGESFEGYRVIRQQ